MIHIGLDISLNSPGVSLARNGQLFALCFEQRKRVVPVKACSAVCVTVLPAPLDTSNDDLLRYTYIVDSIVSWLSDQVPPTERAEAVLYYENYVYSKSAHNYKLHEITGILKYVLAKAGFTKYQTVSVTSWKKELTGNAFADKYEVLQTVNQELGVDLVDLFQTKLGVEKVVRKRKRKLQPMKLTRSVPCPLQDISDAIGIILPIYKKHKH